jgi:two-component system, chemotaxis family, sensor kinase CheA
MAEDRFKYFRVEARDILEQLGQGMLGLEKGAPVGETVALLLRLAHTLKGAARVVRQPEIAEHAHALEDALAFVRDAVLPVPRDAVDRVLEIVDAIGQLVARLSPAPEGKAGGAPGESGRSEEPLAGFRPAMDDLDALLGGVFETQVRLSALRPTLFDAEEARRTATLIVDQLGRIREAEAPGVGQASLDSIRAIAEQLRASCDTLERDLMAGVEQLDRELRQVRVAAERLRLTPASALFAFLERAARDVAHTLGKRVAFDASGGEVRVDTFVLNVVQRALLHIVRNAVAHGIETGVEARRAAGKGDDGHVTLSVSQRGRFVSFACTDDGQGIDLDAVLRVARRDGIAIDGTPDAEAILRLLLRGGISTSGNVTNISGRGIGLDVLREAAERLGGEATARTEAGKGTTIEIVVPVSVASFSALIVETAGAVLAIPVDAVLGARRLARDDIVRTEMRESVLFNGAAIPLASLPRPEAVGRPPVPSASLSIVVVRGRAGVAAFGVDRVVGTTQVVMRPLPEFAPATGIIAGTTLDDVGDPLLILDPDGLVASAHDAEGGAAVAQPVRHRVLVVDDSLTTRMLERSILESAGYDVEVATSGEEALVISRTNAFALFLVDVEMPGMDGFTLIERFRADPALARVPAILVTSRNAPEDRQRGMDAGAQDYIIKSEFDQNVLLERIRTLIS